MSSFKRLLDLDVILRKGKILRSRDILSVALLFAVLPAAEAQLSFDGTILDRANRYDGYPVHLFDQGQHRIWFCGQSPATSSDAIYHSVKAGDLSTISGWSTPQELFNINDVDWAQAGGGIHVCDPSVIKGEFSYDAS